MELASTAPPRRWRAVAPLHPGARHLQRPPDRAPHRHLRAGAGALRLPRRRYGLRCTHVIALAVHAVCARAGRQHEPRACEACGRPLDSDHLHLCGLCAAIMDRATGEPLEREHFDGWSGRQRHEKAPGAIRGPFSLCRWAAAAVLGRSAAGNRPILRRPSAALADDGLPCLRDVRRPADRAGARPHLAGAVPTVAWFITTPEPAQWPQNSFNWSAWSVTTAPFPAGSAPARRPSGPRGRPGRRPRSGSGPPLHKARAGR
jgi:hypothetical protein